MQQDDNVVGHFVYFDIELIERVVEKFGVVPVRNEEHGMEVIEIV
jgi:hypothetical protein